MEDIKIIENINIDTVLWDRCVARSQNGDVFGYSWFLDSVCDKWAGLVKGNYSAVMPVALNRFLKIKYIKNYKFLNKINIYSYNEITNEEVSSFLKKIKNISKNVKITTENEKIYKKSRKSKIFYSYKLDLIRPYEDIIKPENKFIIKQLSNSEENKNFFNTGILPNGIMLLSTLTKSLNKKDINILTRLSSKSLRKGLGQIYGAFNEKNRLIAAVLFISSHYKINIVHTVQTKEAESKKALYGLIDHYIKKHSERALTLDFFGLKGFDENYFKELSAVKYPYYELKL